MRTLLPVTALVAGILSQTPGPSSVMQSTSALLSIASTLAGLSILVYRLGVWRAEMQNTKHSVGAEVARYREESREGFARLERRFEALDQVVVTLNEQRIAVERLQARTDTELAAMGRRLGDVERRAEAA